MLKIRLLILLSISFILFSCAKNFQSNNKINYSLGYVSGEYDGLILKNLLTSGLSSFGLFSNNSVYKIEANISHNSSLFITNIDNTSDRMKIDSELSIKIIDQRFKCVTNKFEEKTSQFYIFADSDKYISNNQAEKKIKEENTETLVRIFINALKKPKATCMKINE